MSRPFLLRNKNNTFVRITDHDRERNLGPDIFWTLLRSSSSDSSSDAFDQMSLSTDMGSDSDVDPMTGQPYSQSYLKMKHAKSKAKTK